MTRRGINHSMIFYKRSSYSKGFTLIELLVVIAIIGILASVVIANLDTARTKAADAAHKTEVKQLKTAIESYYLDNGTCPQYSSPNIGYRVDVALTPHLVETYISQISLQLVVDNDQYVHATNGIGYAILVTLKDGSRCKTGVNVSTGWWGVAVPLCNF